MKQLFFLILSCLNLLFNPLFLAETLGANRQNFSSEFEAEQYLTTHYNLGCEAYTKHQWGKASSEFEKVVSYFPRSAEGAKAYYYLGVSYFYQKEFDHANTAFNQYLKSSEQPAFFEDAVQYKFCIAEYFRAGFKRRVLGIRFCPKIASGTDLALTIYDEVIAALPYCELSARAMYVKAELLRQRREYREAIDTYQTLIRRFPKNEIIPACYLGIQETYCQQSRDEFKSPELIALAELNARRFRTEFPRDDRVALADELVVCVKEAYAQEFCDLGMFFERKGKPTAAAIYYQSAVEEFPTTAVAQSCRCHLRTLGYTIDEDEVPKTSVLNQIPVEERETGLGDREHNPLGPELPTGPEAIREKSEGVPLITGSVNEDNI